MGNAFQRLMISVNDPTLSVVPFGDVRVLNDYEPEAYGHWIFDQESTAHYTSKKGDKVLTPVGTINNTGPNFLSMSGSVGNALVTDIADTAQPTDTYCFVIRNPTVAAARTFFGNANAEVNKGLQLYLNNATGNLTARHYTASAFATGLTTPLNQWIFVAMSRNQPAARRSYLVGGQTAVVNSAAGAYTPTVAAVPLHLGNRYYVASTNSANIDYAEFQAYNKELTAADLAVLYVRSKARMAERGITVV